MTRYDYLRTEDNDLLFENGDLVVGTSDEQHIKDILMSSKGSNREFPLLGANLHRFVKSQRTFADFERVIKMELLKDRYSNVKIEPGEKGIEDFNLTY